VHRSFSTSLWVRLMEVPTVGVESDSIPPSTLGGGGSFSTSVVVAARVTFAGSFASPLSLGVGFDEELDGIVDEDDAEEAAASDNPCSDDCLDGVESTSASPSVRRLFNGGSIGAYIVVRICSNL